MTTDGESRFKSERSRSQDEDETFSNQNSCSGTPAKEPGRSRARGKLVFEMDRTRFLQDLYAFHEKNGTPFMRPPKIGSRDVDLHRLYSVVISRGGWLKVNSREDWDEVIEELKLPKRCVNNEIALKQIYIRYLDKYERVNFHGEEKDPAEEEDDEKRHNRRWTARMLHSIPSVYNHAQHNVPESQRSSLNMSCDLYQPTEYEKLILSLLSPLPNEQDFAINVCTLMSNESKHTLKVDKCPKLIDVLLAHAGVFSHYTLRDMFDEYYGNIRKNSLHRFWKDCLYEKPQVLELSYQDYFQKLEKDPTELIKSIYTPDLNKSIDDDDECGMLNMATLRSFLSLGPGLGTNDYIGQRVYQIASIFRNLSFNDENISALACNRQFLRFLIMSANSRWGNLCHMGLDMLGNVATEIEVNDPQMDEVTRCLVSTISEGLEGVDRGVIIGCLEILSKMAQKESNEDNLNRCLNQKIYDQICLFLSLNDIMLLIYTLECIYSLTSVGEKPCNAFMHVTGIIDTLVSLVSVEAQSYGPDACILMRVVETIPGNMAGVYPGNHYQNTAPVNPSQGPTMAQLTVHNKDQPSIPVPNIPALPEITKTPPPSKPASPAPALSQSNATTMPAPAIPAVTQATPIQVTSVTRPPSSQSPQIPVNIISRNDPSSPAVHQKLTKASGQAANTNSTASASGSPSAGPITVAAKHAQQQQSQENEQFAYAWLKATFEATPSLTSRIEQSEVYKLYLAANSKIGRKAVVPQVHLPRCVRTVFGGSVGPTLIKTTSPCGVENSNYFYEGIKLRPKLPQSSLSGTGAQKGVSMLLQSDKTLVQPKLAGGGPISGKGAAAGKPVYITQLANKSVVMNPENDSQGTSQLSGDSKNNVIVVNQTTISPQPLGSMVQGLQQPQQATGTTTIMNQSGTISSTTTNPSALIKSLLANKVTTVTSNESAATSSSGGIVVSSSYSTATSSFSSTTTSPSTPATSQSLIASNVNVHQVAQRQQLLKQKQMKSPSPVASPPPNSSVVVTSNNPNNLTNIKVGNSTISIKPGTLPTNTVITATNPHEMNPPPLAPLSQNPGGHMKSLTGETTVKRKSDIDGTEPPSKKIDMETEEVKVTPKAADLYAELAGSILEDEDMEDIEMKPKEEPKIKVQTAPAQQVITMPMQRQIIMAPNNPQPMLLSPGGSGQHLTAQTTATIKTDSGYQTVPILLQHNQNQIQIQKTAPVMTPTVISNPQQTTQYILATNQQGQTYVVAQQPQPQPQMQQTVLLTQNPQTGAQQKTIIILQQQPQQSSGSQMQTQQIQAQQIQTQQMQAQSQGHPPQKVFVNQQGQQIIMTQVPRQVQHQGNTISIEGTSQQIIKSSQQPAQIMQQQTHQQIQQIIQQGGGQTFQIIQQPAQQTSSQPTQQIMIQSQPPQQPQQSQIVIQQQPHTSQQMQPQIISQQIIQPATQQQPQVVQKIIQQKLVHAPSQHHQQKQQPQIITVQKQPISHSSGATTITKQTATTSSPQVGQLPTKTIIVQQQPSTTGGTPQKQVIQVLQQKISSPSPQSAVLQKSQIVHGPGPLPAKAAVPQSQLSVESTIHSASATSAALTSEPTKHASKSTILVSREPATTVAPASSATVTAVHTKGATTTSVIPVTASSTTTTVTAGLPTATVPVAGSNSTIQMIPAMDPSKAVDEDVDPSWPWVCDWRGCPRKKFSSANEVYIHACAVHCPDTVDSAADIYCQWGPGPNLCDNLPRKRFSLMTHIFDRHCTSESFKQAVQRRVSSSGTSTTQQAYPVTLVRQPASNAPGSSASSTTSESSACSSPAPPSAPQPQGAGILSSAGPAAMHAIKRHAIDWINAKEFQDDIEGPVTKSIRLTSALILRNLVVYNNSARRALRAYEPHLAGVAMNNVESSRTISQVLFEMNDAQPNY
ncbi:AT-rich interactive domain-containing protein 2 isoform X3 [Armigeres subalbatus]|uniref:AT-rich interactive domain-containing protein 2 isoform X3 n=1 Tax=Armigeres subalbatus TaxID=124917 RepID=UPI002ECFE604